MSDTYLQFGSFRFKAGKGLWRRNYEIRLPPKEMALLDLLTQSQGEVVTHEVIYKSLWPRQSIASHSITRCVYSLRKSLQPEGPEYIKTIPKRGYQLAVPVQNPRQKHRHTAQQSSIQTNPRSYSHYLQGLASITNADPESLKQALHWFKESIRVDPGFAAGHAAIAEVTMYQCYRGYIHPQDGLRIGLNACHAALKSDPEIVQALSLRGWFEALQNGEMERGTQSLEQVLQLDPEYSRAYAYLALIHRAQGDIPAATRCAVRAAELDPHSLFIAHTCSFTQFLAGNLTEALNSERLTLENHPKDDLALGYMSIFLASLGEHHEALDFARKALKQAKNIPAMWGFMAWSLAVCGETEEASRLVEEAYAACLPRCPRPIMVPALVALGQTDRAFALLQEAREEQCPWFFGIRADPRLAELRGDRRWQALYR